MKYNKIFIVGLLGLLLASCADEFLDVPPQAKSFTENFYSTEEEVFNGLNAAYDFLVWDYATDNPSVNAEGLGYASSFMMRCIASDNANAGGGTPSDIADWQEMDEFRPTTKNGSLMMHWQRSYFGIYRSNLIIDREYENLTDTIKRYIAEARFLRAYFHWELVTYFGSVPIVDKALSLADSYPPQNTASEVYKFIAEELQAIIPILPYKKDYASNDYHRASKGAAQALLGKVYMFQNKYSEASAVFEDLFASNQYELDNDYANIFSVEGEFGVESIFEINYTRNYPSDWEANRSRAIEGNVNSQLMGVRGLAPNSYYEPGWGFNKVELSLIAAFDAENDSIRKYNSAYSPSELGIGYSDAHKHTGWFCKKMAPDKASYGDNSGASELDYEHNEVVMRLADFYLLYAEAQYELGNESVAIEYLNYVRERVNLPLYEGANIPSGQALFDAIVKERRLELAMEGHRYFDLIRWGLAETVLQNQWGGSFNASIHTVFPIPQQEITRSEGVLKQNSGY